MSDNPIYGYLETLPKEYRVSDFHMRAGSPLAMRVNGEIEVMQDLPITHDWLDDLSSEELSATGFARRDCFRTAFRANLSHHARLGLILRTIVMPNIDQLGLPQAVHNVLREKRGWYW